MAVPQVSSRHTSVRRRRSIAVAVSVAMSLVALAGPGASAQSAITVVTGVGEGTVSGNAFMPGDLVYFVTFYHDQLAGQVSQYEILTPSGNLWMSWTGWSGVAHYSASWWYWSWYLPGDPEVGYWTFRVTFEGQTEEHIFSVGDVSDVPETGIANFVLHAPTPNPFNPSTNIGFALTIPGIVELSIHDMQGHRVATLNSGEMGAGEHEVQWDGRSDAGQSVASGVYLVNLRQGEQLQSRRVVLLK